MCLLSLHPRIRDLQETKIKYKLKATHPVDGSVEGDGVWKRGGAHHAAPLGQEGGLKL